MTQYLVMFVLGASQAMIGVGLWAVAKRLDLHIKKRGHDGRN